MSFIIQDWAGNICFHAREFESFEAAWDFIHENVPLEGDYPYDDYFVIEARQLREKRYLDPKDPRQGMVAV